MSWAALLVRHEWHECRGDSGTRKIQELEWLKATTQAEATQEVADILENWAGGVRDYESAENFDYQKVWLLEVSSKARFDIQKWFLKQKTQEEAEDKAEEEREAREREEQQKQKDEADFERLKKKLGK